MDRLTVSGLVKTLKTLPGDWVVFGTTQGSLEVREPGDWRTGMRYAYVFPDGRPTQFYTVRR